MQMVAALFQSITFKACLSLSGKFFLVDKGNVDLSLVVGESQGVFFHSDK